MCHRAAACLWLLVVPLLGAWLALTAAGEEAERKDEAGFRPLFDGKTLEGWEGSLKTFRVEDGAIIGGSLYEKIPNNEFLCTKREFGDFELRLEARLRGDGTNAGVQFRSRRVPDHFEVSGYQCDIGTMQDKPIWGWLYDESRRNKFLMEGPDEELRRVVKPGRWNDLVIRCEGPQITIWVNGQKTVEYREADDQVARRGIIGLQIHGGPPAEASYRNIRIKELGPSDTRSGTATGPVAAEKLAAVRATDTDLKLIFVGDVMLDDLPGQVIQRGEDPFREFAEAIRWADVAVANLECVVATGGVAVKKPWVFRAAPGVLPILKRYFPVVSLANNHTGDYGHAAFLQQGIRLEQFVHARDHRIHQLDVADDARPEDGAKLILEDPGILQAEPDGAETKERIVLPGKQRGRPGDRLERRHVVDSAGHYRLGRGQRRGQEHAHSVAYGSTAAQFGARGDSRSRRVVGGGEALDRILSRRRCDVRGDVGADVRAHDRATSRVPAPRGAAARG